MDNEEARIMVGQNIGIPNGSFTATSGAPGNLATTVQRRDLGVILQIKPLITQSGAIQLDVYQEDSKVDPATLANTVNGPTITERTLRTTLLVDDGQIIALGGMTEDTIQIVQNGIPGLSEIPYLGWLFSWQQRTHSKTNLVLFLRPVIIKNAEGYRVGVDIAKMGNIELNSKIKNESLKLITYEDDILLNTSLKNEKSITIKLQE